MAIGVKEATFEMGWAKFFKVFCNWKTLKLFRGTGRQNFNCFPNKIGQN